MNLILTGINGQDFYMGIILNYICRARVSIFWEIKNLRKTLLAYVIHEGAVDTLMKH